MNRRMILLTWGHSNPTTAKTATGLLRYCAEECVAIFDPDSAGKTAAEVLEIGGKTPVVSRLEEAPTADTLVMGIAPPGGKIPEAWRQVVLEAIARGMNILSGLHDFLSDDPEISGAAASRGVTITDIRKNVFRQVARRADFRADCLRLHTVGHDCSVGKMVVSLELARGLTARGRDACFVATGQTGIMVSGSGLPIDCMAADFVSGAAERLVLDHEKHDILVVEGQGSLVHPSYSGVTLGLLHGCQPHGLVFVFEAGRETIRGLDHISLPSLQQQMKLFRQMSNIYQKCEFIAMAMNGRLLSPVQAKDVAARMEDEFELPVVDVIRDGRDRLVDVANAFYESGSWRSAGR